MASINGKKVNNAGLTDVNQLIQAGINPKNGLPIKMSSLGGSDLEENILKQLRILDEQNAINRFKWYNLPNGLDGQLLERILYYKGQGAFFYMKTNNTFYFLPYALDGSIDVYGRYTGITPLPFNGKADDDKKSKPWITGLIRTPVYDVLLEDEIKNNAEDGCVLLNDYSKQISQTVLSRQLLQDPLLKAMAEAFPMARTSLLSNSGIKGIRVDSQNEQMQVELASKQVTNAAKTGNPWIPIVGHVEFQELTEKGSALKSEEYLLYLQALDNFRLSLYGLKNGGLFQKKSHMLQDEQDMNDGTTELVMQDGLAIRKNFCHIVNSIWNLGIDVEFGEAVSQENTNSETDENNEINDKGEPTDEE